MRLTRCSLTQWPAKNTIHGLNGRGVTRDLHSLTATKLHQTSSQIIMMRYNPTRMLVNVEILVADSNNLFSTQSLHCLS